MNRAGRRAGRLLPRLKSVLARLMRKSHAKKKPYVLIHDDGCWYWLRSKIKGYGTLSIQNKPHKAHRFIYESLKGHIPDGLTLDHRCRNRACVNPDHLEPVTNRINILRGISFSAENFRKDSCKRGHLLSKGNLYLRPSGGRSCMACQRMARKRLRKNSI
jgi:hypothetical protein